LTCQFLEQDIVERELLFGVVPELKDIRHAQADFSPLLGIGKGSQKLLAKTNYCDVLTVSGVGVNQAGMKPRARFRGWKSPVEQHHQLAGPRTIEIDRRLAFFI